MKNTKKPYWEMNAQELQKATAKYDKEFGGWDEFHPMTQRERTKYRRTLRRGRPKIGKGAKRVMVSIEGGLLKRADAYAKAQGLKRSELIAKSLETVLSRAG
jgi:hypothetical protein